MDIPLYILRLVYSCILCVRVLCFHASQKKEPDLTREGCVHHVLGTELWASG